MLGTPNHGSFEVVQGMRGSHWVLHILSALDGRHSSAELALRCFSSWPSVYAALPDRASPADLDLFDPGTWPAEGVRPREDFLAAARTWLAGHDEGDIHVIAGYGFPTLERIELAGTGFRYHSYDGGDGMVATSRARLEGFPCYFTRCPHIGMPNHLDVIAAVEDILDHGSTERLATEPPAPSPFSLVSDDDAFEPPFGGRRGPQLTAADLRNFFEELAGIIAPVTMG
jgi:hypothetical protein